VKQAPETASQATLANDAGDGVAAAGEIKFVFEALGAEAGLLAEFDDLPFQRGGDLMSATIGLAAQLLERGKLARNIMAHPFADGVAITAELAPGEQRQPSSDATNGGRCAYDYNSK
jgi:hypothetical protein